MSAMFKLQRGVPRPPRDKYRRPPRRRKWPLEQMAPGDFFFVPGRARPSVSAYVSRIAANLPGKFAVERVWAWEDKRDNTWRLCEPSAVGATEGVGVWRTK